MESRNRGWGGALCGFQVSPPGFNSFYRHATIPRSGQVLRPAAGAQAGQKSNSADKAGGLMIEETDGGRREIPVAYFVARVVDKSRSFRLEDRVFIEDGVSDDRAFVGSEEDMDFAVARLHGRGVTEVARTRGDVQPVRKCLRVIG